MSRIEELEGLIRLRLKADGDEALIDFYQFGLREIRPTPDEFDYIDREVGARRAAQNSGIDPPSASTTYLPAQDVINAFRDATPMRRLYDCINRSNVKWQENSQDVVKAYVMACFSELAYLHLTEVELAERDRYKIFEPSLAQSEIFRRRLRIDLSEVMPSTADIAVQVIEVGRFVFFVAQVAKFVVIAVRGTVVTSLREWMIDFEALKNPARNGFYHRGFDDEARIALPLLLKAVGDRKPLYITGHSLGAAVAAILCQIWSQGDVVKTPYLFAAPRFGTRAAARRQPRFTYVRPLDLVPHVPPKFLGFSDAGSITTVIPRGSKQGTGLLSVWNMVSRLTAEQHSMEGHRKLLGDEIGEVFPERVYIDAIMKCLK